LSLAAVQKSPGRRKRLGSSEAASPSRQVTADIVEEEEKDKSGMF